MTIDLDSIDDKPNEDPRDWSKPSRAVIACAEPWRAIVLWYVGPHVESFIEQIGGRDVEELGFANEPPIGISVWEGTITGGRYNSHTGDYDDAELTGTYRAPSVEEWRWIRQGQCPWDPDAWLLRKPEAP